jgi:hypothetical protein
VKQLIKAKRLICGLEINVAPIQKFNDISFRLFRGSGVESSPSENEYEEDSWG